MTASQKQTWNSENSDIPQFSFLWKVFCPRPSKKKEFGHVPDTSGICPGCPRGLSIGYLRLSAGQNVFGKQTQDVRRARRGENVQSVWARHEYKSRQRVGPWSLRRERASNSFFLRILGTYMKYSFGILCTASTPKQRMQDKMDRKVHQRHIIPAVSWPGPD